MFGEEEEAEDEEEGLSFPWRQSSITDFFRPAADRDEPGDMTLMGVSMQSEENVFRIPSPGLGRAAVASPPKPSFLPTTKVRLLYLS